MQYLCQLRLSHNQIKGTLNDFSQALPPDSLLSFVELQNNNLEGTLIVPDIVKLAVFSSALREEPFFKVQRHLFDVSNNRLEGPIEDTLLQVRPRPPPINPLHTTCSKGVVQLLWPPYTQALSEQLYSPALFC